MRKNVAVIFGGRSCENEISIITGAMTANLLDTERYEVYPVYIAQSGEMYAGKELQDTDSFRGANYQKKADRAAFLGNTLYAVRRRKLHPLAKIDCAINCCHGMGGEDGAVAALLDMNGIADASPDMAASALFMDKALTKLAAKALGVRTLPYFRISEAEYKKRGAFAVRCIEERLGYPVIVKPARQGSSIGIAVAEDRARLLAAIEAAFHYDTLLIAEKYLSERREINCACYKNGDELVVSCCEEPKTSHKFLTFGDKYLDGGKENKSDFPAKISKASAELVQGYTKLLYRRLNLRGVVRADFLLSGNEVYFNEMNTVPGSLAWYLFCKNMGDFKHLLTAFVEQGICDFVARSEKKMLAGCGVLKGTRAGAKRRG